MKTRVWTVISSLVVIGVLAGCGGGGTASSGQPGDGASPGGSPATAAGLTCGLVPASLVNTALGTNVGDPKAQELGKILVCRYEPVTGGRGNVVVRIQTDMSRETFDKSRTLSDANGLPTADLPGFEDAAYTSVLTAGPVKTNTVVALRGSVEILVSSPASFDAEKAFEEQIFSKLV